MSRSHIAIVGISLFCLALLWLVIRRADWFASAIFRQNKAAQLKPPGVPLQLDPVNPHYFLFRGETIPLIAASPGYGAVTNLDANYGALLNNLSSAGLNKIRIFTGDFIIVDSSKADSLHAKPNRVVKPWAKSTTPGYAGQSHQRKYDLNTWDNDFFTRLDRFVSLANEKGIVVEITLFSQHYDDQIWSFSPLKSSNNVNGVTNLSWRDFFSLSDPDLVARQDAYVRKVVSSLNQYDNIYFEIANEAWGSEWHDQIAKTIVDTEAALPNKHLIAVDGPEVYSGLKSKVHVLNTHYVDDLGAAGKIHWIAAFPLLDNYYDLNIPLGFDETSLTPKHQSPDEARVEAWEFIIGGGAVYDNLNIPPPNKTLYRYLKNLKDFMLGFDLRKMSQDKTLIASGLSEGSIWRASSDKAGQYAVYIHHGTPGPNHYVVTNSTFEENPQLNLPPGQYTVTWINPTTGKPVSSDNVTSNGIVHLRSPRFVADIALKIVRSSD